MTQTAKQSLNQAILKLEAKKVSIPRSVAEQKRNINIQKEIDFFEKYIAYTEWKAGA